MKVFSLKKMIEHQPVLKELHSIFPKYIKDDGREVESIGSSFIDSDGKTWNSNYIIDKKEWGKYE